MAELKVEVSDDLRVIAENIGKEELSRIVSDALRNKSSESLLFKYADAVLKDSEISDEDALRLGNELKKKVAKRHGLM